MNRLLAKTVTTLLSAGFNPREIKTVTGASGAYIAYHRRQLGLIGVGQERIRSEKIESMLLAGNQPMDIRRALGVPGSVVSYCRKGLGLKPFKRGRKRGHSERVLAIEKEVRRLKVEGLTYAEIGQRMGFSYQRAQQYLMIGAPKLDGQKCEKCGGTENIQRHHVNYETNEIQFLCCHCHGAENNGGDSAVKWFLDNAVNPKGEECVNCLFPKCDKTPSSRGLCHNHYQVAIRMVSSKRTTWRELEKLGKCLKPYQKQPSTWFLSDAPATPNPLPCQAA